MGARHKVRGSNEIDVDKKFTYCPICDIKIKRGNLRGHIVKVHPSPTEGRPPPVVREGEHFIVNSHECWERLYEAVELLEEDMDEDSIDVLRGSRQNSQGLVTYLWLQVCVTLG